MTPQGGSRSDVNPLALLLAGGTAGVACWVVCFPQDLIKARIQVSCTVCSAVLRTVSESASKCALKDTCRVLREGVEILIRLFCEIF